MVDDWIPDSRHPEGCSQRRDLSQNDPRHGLAIADDLESPTRTVYNALQRLEEMGDVESSWQTSNGVRNS